MRRALDTRALCFGLAEAKLARPSEACEVLLIAVPHDVHEDIAGMGLRAGKHVRLRVVEYSEVREGGRRQTVCTKAYIHGTCCTHTHTTHNTHSII